MTEEEAIRVSARDPQVINLFLEIEKQREKDGGTLTSEKFESLLKMMPEGLMASFKNDSQAMAEFLCDLTGSMVYDATGYKGAEAAHKRMQNRADEFASVVAFIAQNPSEVGTAIVDGVTAQWNAYKKHREDGNYFEAAFVFGTLLKETVELLADAPVGAAKKVSKISSTVGELVTNKKAYREGLEKITDLDPLPLEGYKGRLTELRNKPGVASTGNGLPRIKEGDLWLKGSHGNAAKVPAQVAEKLAGRKFADFKAFREAFWREVAADPALSKTFSPQSVGRMRKGLASKISKKAEGQIVGRRDTYELDHNIEIQHGGGVYDMDNIIIRTPLNHLKGK